MGGNERPERPASADGRTVRAKWNGAPGAERRVAAVRGGPSREPRPDPRPAGEAETNAAAPHRRGVIIRPRQGPARAIGPLPQAETCRGSAEPGAPASGDVGRGRVGADRDAPRRRRRKDAPLAGGGRHGGVRAGPPDVIGGPAAARPGRAKSATRANKCARPLAARRSRPPECAPLTPRSFRIQAPARGAELPPFF